MRDVDVTRAAAAGPGGLPAETILTAVASG